MTIYSAVLFLHVLSAIALFIAFLLEGVIFIRVRSARSIEQARFFTRAALQANRSSAIMSGRPMVLNTRRAIVSVDPDKAT